MTAPHTGYIRHLALITAFILTAVFRAHAFSESKYSTSSVLASGHWVKVSITDTGMHFIPAATLRSWGFSDVKRVHVHGYGAARIPDLLSSANYVDDLPEQPLHITDAGIYFYAVGPVSWSTVNSRYVHTLNPFTEKGYYFITESDEPAVTAPTEGWARQPQNPSTTFTERIWHELDAVSLSTSGHQLYGEDFRFTPSRTFNFDLTGLVPGTKAWMRTRFVTNTTSSSSLSITANGTVVGSGTNRIDATGSDNYGDAATFDHQFTPDAERLSVALKHNPAGTVKAAHLDAITINYTRALSMPASGHLDFGVSTTSVLLSGSGEGTMVWDVTDPLRIFAIPTVDVSGGTGWVNSYTGSRRYTAWREGASLPQPSYVSTIDNQDIHSITDIPDMVIFTISDWAGEAERLADMHRTGSDSLKVIVVDQEMVFNEFASGAPDVNSFRKMLKMLYDRGQSTSSRKLKYALFMGRATFDNRVLTQNMQALRQKFMPTWQSDESLRETGSYTSDDIFAFLEDNSGRDMAQDTHCIAIGRLPVRTLGEARTMVDKIINYTSHSESGPWQTRIIAMADDGDIGKHMLQTDAAIDSMRTALTGRFMLPTRVFVDAYELKAGAAEGGRNLLYRKLNEGVLWWNYLGHGDRVSLSNGKLVTLSDVSSLNLRTIPFMAAYTCLFMRWDDHELSGGEMLALNDKGGVISLLSTMRKSYISNNGTLAAEISAESFRRDEAGRQLTVGEMIRRGKNRLSKPYQRRDENKLRYALLGDPAMRLAVPELFVRLETINGETVDPDKQITLMARQNVTMTGTIVDADGNKVESFSGPLYTTLYDAETSTTTLGRPRDNVNGLCHVYDEPGAMLYQGRDSVRAGEFAIRIAMPFETADNFRPATVQFFASAAGHTEAAGMNSDFYIYGTDDSADSDTIPPTVDYAVLNHDSFHPGQTVNESPMLLAKVSDNVGINLSMAGIGHQMTLRLDNRTTYTDIPLYYTPNADGTPGGSIAYPLSGLTEGDHSLTLRVWDTSGNSTQHTLPFKVQQGALPTVFDIYTDANPASTQARFYITHNRPDADMTVTFEVFNMLGRRVWCSTVTDRSNMFTSAPVTWDLTDMGGHRVTRGIYLYRAIISTPDGEIHTAAKRIAVTGGH
ncbi:MAG: type IX secretion system sortase PorU [Muribaculaceae bacterium]|nr:type IX secretion system sortase PorU [Muribaculaceae bacterium]